MNIKKIEDNQVLNIESDEITDGEKHYFVLLNLSCKGSRVGALGHSILHKTYKESIYKVSDIPMYAEGIDVRFFYITKCLNKSLIIRNIAKYAYQKYRLQQNRKRN